MNSMTTNNVVVPWDFSEMSMDALKKAAEIAVSSDKIKVVHVTPYPDAMEPSVVWGSYNEEDIQQNLHNSFFKDVSETEYPGIEFNAMFGDPGHQISRFAEECDAGLIVISSHGRTGLGRFLLGSVAERVVRLAPCPVLVLRSK